MARVSKGESGQVTDLQLRRQLASNMVDGALARVHEQGLGGLVLGGLQDLDFAHLLQGKASTVSVPFPFASRFLRQLAGGDLRHAPAV